jgi:hypothetical protein
VERYMVAPKAVHSPHCGHCEPFARITKSRELFGERDLVLTNCSDRSSSVRRSSSRSCPSLMKFGIAQGWGLTFFPVAIPLLEHVDEV